LVTFSTICYFFQRRLLFCYFLYIWLHLVTFFSFFLLPMTKIRPLSLISLKISWGRTSAPPSIGIYFSSGQGFYPPSKGTKMRPFSFFSSKIARGRTPGSPATVSTSAMSFLRDIDVTRNSRLQRVLKCVHFLNFLENFSGRPPGTPPLSRHWQLFSSGH